MAQARPSFDTYLERLATCAQQYAIVKLCDRITNLQPPPSTWARSKIAEYHGSRSVSWPSSAMCTSPAPERLRTKMWTIAKLLKSTAHAGSRAMMWRRSWSRP